MKNMRERSQISVIYGQRWSPITKSRAIGPYSLNVFPECRLDNSFIAAQNPFACCVHCRRNEPSRGREKAKSETARRLPPSHLKVNVVGQLKSFLCHTSRTLSDKQIAQLSTVVNRDTIFKQPLLVLDQLGNELSRLYRLQEPDEDISNNAIKPQTSSLSPIIQEFVRFIEVSAGLEYELRPDENSYQAQVTADPETFLCFREHNKTYQHLISSVKIESCQGEPLFLARWMMWRLYAWGLYHLQAAFGNSISSAADIFRCRREVARDHNKEAVVVKTYGSRYRICLPTDLESMEKIWEHGTRIWANWQKQSLPIAFGEAQRAIRAQHVPMYSTGHLSQLLLFGDLARLGIVVSPTESEMAKLILKAGSGALNGLKILGFGCSEEEVKDAFCFLRDVLNSHLDKEAKSLFHEGEVSVFDLEHALCKVSRKQSQKLTMSPIWSTSIVSKKRKGQGLAPGGRKRRKLDGK